MTHRRSVRTLGRLRAWCYGKQGLGISFYPSARFTLITPKILGMIFLALIFVSPVAWSPPNGFPLNTSRREKMKLTKLFVFALIAAVAAIALTTIGFAAIATPAAPAVCDSVVVTESDITRQAEDTPPTDNWVLYTRAAGNGTFRSGPGTPPSGVGSFETV